MPTVECPWCAAELAPDLAMRTLTCDDCCVTVEIAPDPVTTARELAA